MIKKYNIKQINYVIIDELLVDNAGMIGVVAYYKALQKDFADPETLDWNPRQLLN